MSVDFAALATAVVSGVSDVRTCLVVSRDGLALGACPASEEEKALAIWSKIAALGEVERGFVAHRDEVWAFCRRGPYAALAAGGPTTRAGLVLDALDQLLLAAEEARVRKDVLKSSPEREAAPAEPPRGLRSALHPGSREESPQLEPVDAMAGSSPETSMASTGSDQDVAEPHEPYDLEVGAQPSSDDPPPERSWEVDRAALNREFAGLLSQDQDDDEH